LSCSPVSLETFLAYSRVTPVSHSTMIQKVKRSRAHALWTHAGFKFIHRWQKRRAHRTEMANYKQN